MASRGGRPLDLAGRYFAVLDQLWPANVVCVAELDTVFGAADVDAAWQQVCAANPVARSRLAVDDGAEPLLVDDPSVTPDYRSCRGTLLSLLADEQRDRFDVSAGPLARCRYVVTDQGSSIVLTGHHAVLDGRGGYALLQQLAGVLAGGRPVAHRPLPPGLNDRVRPGLRWPHDRRLARGVLRELGELRHRAGATDELLGPCDEVAERELYLTRHRLDEAAIEALLKHARAARATGYGMIAAAWLQATHDLFDDARSAHNLLLTTPADLRARLDPPVPADVAGMYASVISTSHLVEGGDPAALASEISTTVQAAVDRGEGELFYALARPDAMRLDERGAAMMRRALVAAPQTLAVSNTGRLPQGVDPEWVRNIWLCFAPTPNQLAFVTATTYRGQLTMTACVDHARLPAGLADRLVAGAVDRLRALASIDGA